MYLFHVNALRNPPVEAGLAVDLAGHPPAVGSFDPFWGGGLRLVVWEDRAPDAPPTPAEMIAEGSAQIRDGGAPALEGLARYTQGLLALLSTPPRRLRFAEYVTGGRPAQPGGGLIPTEEPTDPWALVYLVWQPRHTAEGAVRWDDQYMVQILPHWRAPQHPPPGVIACIDHTAKPPSRGPFAAFLVFTPGAAFLLDTAHGMIALNWHSERRRLTFSLVRHCDAAPSEAAPDEANARPIHIPGAGTLDLEQPPPVPDFLTIQVQDVGAPGVLPRRDPLAPHLEYRRDLTLADLAHPDDMLPPLHTRLDCSPAHYTQQGQERMVQHDVAPPPGEATPE